MFGSRKYTEQLLRDLVTAVDRVNNPFRNVDGVINEQAARLDQENLANALVAADFWLTHKAAV